MSEIKEAKSPAGIWRVFGLLGMSVALFCGLFVLCLKIEIISKLANSNALLTAGFFGLCLFIFPAVIIRFPWFFAVHWRISGKTITLIVPSGGFHALLRHIENTDIESITRRKYWSVVTRTNQTQFKVPLVLMAKTSSGQNQKVTFAVARNTLVFKPLPC